MSSLCSKIIKWHECIAFLKNIGYTLYKCIRIEIWFPELYSTALIFEMIIGERISRSVNILYMNKCSAF